MWEFTVNGIKIINEKLDSILDIMNKKADKVDCPKEHHLLMTTWNLKFLGNQKAKIMPDRWADRLKWVAMISFLGLISGGSLIAIIRELEKLLK